MTIPATICLPANGYRYHYHLPAAGEIATSPATAPLSRPSALTRPTPTTAHSVRHQESAAAVVAIWVACMTYPNGGEGEGEGVEEEEEEEDLTIVEEDA